MHLPGAKHCGGQRRIQPNLAGSDLLFSQQRSGEPSLSRAGLTSIGRQIERTPLCDQTSPRRAPSHSSKMSMDLAFRVSSNAADRVILSFYSVWKLYIRPTVQRRCPANNHSSVRSDWETTADEAPSAVFVRFQVRRNRPSSVETARTNEWKHYHMTAITSKAAVNPPG